MGIFLHSLTIHTEEKDLPDIVKKMYQLSSEDGYLEPFQDQLAELTEGFAPVSIDDIKELSSFSLHSRGLFNWLDELDEMDEVSKIFPEALFSVRVTGEGIWEHHFKNGKYQSCYAEIIIPPFDENKLITIPSYANIKKWRELREAK